jgi:putative Ca2+/H+ antiporter (TMEM165/GDT1 family)
MRHMFLLIFLGIVSAQIIMGVVRGVLGIMAATPLVAVIVVLAKLLYLENIYRIG